MGQDGDVLHGHPGNNHTLIEDMRIFAMLGITNKVGDLAIIIPVESSDEDV